jgi:hypothetical protein
MLVIFGPRVSNLRFVETIHLRHPTTLNERHVTADGLSNTIRHSVTDTAGSPIITNPHINNHFAASAIRLNIRV